MSLSSMNRPSLVATAGLAAYGALPFVESMIADSDLAVIKILNLGIYGLSLYAVSQPGRIDGERQEAKISGKTKDDAPDISDYMSGKSLLAPSGWAFAIWGPIFLGELAFVTSSAFMVTDISPVAPLFRRVSGNFMMAHVFQTLWTASFRPAYKGSLAFIAPSMLAGIALSLSRAHAQFCSPLAVMTTPEYLLYFLPMTMHFGWTTAATLVNLNGSIAMNKNLPTTVVAAAGHLSAVAATGLGVYLSLTRQAPVFGSVIAWALSACATGIQKRIDVQAGIKTSKEKMGDDWITAARVQKWLCASGALLSAVASAYASQ